MATKPSDHPDWGGVISVPDETERTNGWSDAEPARAEWFNWFQSLVGDWVRWFDQTIFTPGDVFGPTAMSVAGKSPEVGDPLTIPAFPTAGYISAKAYIGGATVGPAYNFVALNLNPSDDNYIYLNADGTFSVTDTLTVDNAAYMAIWKVTTDATQITTVVDYSTESLTVHRQLNVDATMSFGEGNLTNVAASAALRRRTRYNQAVTTGYTFVEEFSSQDNTVSASRDVTRIYIRNATGNLIKVINAKWSGGTSMWVPEPLSDFCIFQEWGEYDNTIRYEHTAVPFSDAAWQAVNARTSALGRHQAGADLNDTDEERVELPRYYAYGTGGAQPIFGLNIANQLRAYGHHLATTGVNNDNGYGGAFASNASRNDDGTWSRSVAGQDSYLFEITNGGVCVYVHSAAGASPWANTRDAATWALVFEGDLSGLFSPLLTATTLAVSGTASVSRLGVTTSGLGVTNPVVNSLYGGTICKGFGILEWDSLSVGATMTYGEGVNIKYADCSVLDNETVLITLQTPMASGRWFIQGYGLMGGSTDDLLTLYPTNVDKTETQIKVKVVSPLTGSTPGDDFGWQMMFTVWGFQ